MVQGLGSSGTYRDPPFPLKLPFLCLETFGPGSDGQTGVNKGGRRETDRKREGGKKGRGQYGLPRTVSCPPPGGRGEISNQNDLTSKAPRTTPRHSSVIPKPQTDTETCLLVSVSNETRAASTFKLKTHLSWRPSLSSIPSGGRSAKPLSNGSPMLILLG